uniref:Uncharacterized protein n=1 Tax=Arundo donax TaxID=35708 RepID=A0A0A9A0N7_ARUDO
MTPSLAWRRLPSAG